MSDAGDAEYILGCRFRLDPDPPGLRADPDEFETTLYRQADPPGEAGWLFFRDNCWRGDLADPEHVRALAEEALGVTVLSVDFRELRTDEAYLEALHAGIEEHADLFTAEDSTAVLSNHLGSSVHVRERGRDREE
ncbi:MAG: LWR-salt protein [Halorientalis sp.]